LSREHLRMTGSAMKLSLKLVLCWALASIVWAGEDDDNLSISKDVMNFLMKCKPDEPEITYEPRNRVVPVHKIEIGDESGIRSHQVQMLGLDNLGDSLQQALHNSEFSGHVLSKLKDATSRASASVRQSESCPPTTNIISIDVPPQELQIFHERMERVTQQNNNLLQGLIKHMIDTKLEDIERNILGQMDHRLTAMAALMEQKFGNVEDLLKALLVVFPIKNVAVAGIDNSASTAPGETSDPSVKENMPEVLTSEVNSTKVSKVLDSKLTDMLRGTMVTW